MEPLIISAKEDVPSVLFDKNSNIFEITSSVFPENPYEIFKPIYNWLEKYTKAPNPVTVVVCKINYFNTSSAKHIIKLLDYFHTILISNKGTVIIEWYYFKSDENMYDFGKRYCELTGLPFSFIEREHR